MTIQLGSIDRVALFGGSWLMGALCRALPARRWRPMLFTSDRHLYDVVEKSGATLQQVLQETGIPYCSTKDINHELELARFVTDSTLGLALGAAWLFDPETARLFGGRLLDFMGIPLPQFRGGAHYSWQILRQNRQASCNLQVIHGGAESFHKGEILKRVDYFFPTSARIPQDYFDAALLAELAFMQEFFDEVERDQEFALQSLQENFSTFFPCLHTLRNGFIDWRQKADEIDQFICAFDMPYAGASTFLRGKRVFLKDCRADYSDGRSHPFLAGLVYRKLAGALYVAASDAALVVGSARDENGQDLYESIRLGQRFLTPQSVLEEAFAFEAVYDSVGIQS